MPNEDVTINADFLYNASYIAADGTLQSHTATELTSSDHELTSGWYVVSEDVGITPYTSPDNSNFKTRRITVNGDVKLILADGATLDAAIVQYYPDWSQEIILEAAGGIHVPEGSSLTIYGQSQGTGTINAATNSSNQAAIGGGNVSADGVNNSAGTITIYGGKVTATSWGGAGIGGGGTYDAKIYSLIAGRVMGNTYVTMNDGHVMRNVYGGGNMGSVGKGNYASGADDYANDFTIGAAMGYGEKITGNLWTSTSDGDDAWEFLHSGKATVKVLGGTVGYVNETNPVLSMKNELPYGNVFGGSAGEAAPNIAETPRYLYCPAFFSGYVNETEVTIGKTRADFATDGDYETYLASGTPKILASVYGGGQDGHVRRDTRVVVNNGEIGMPYNDTNRTLLQTTGLSLEEELNNPM